MTFNEYRNDLMDNYRSIDRTWKRDGDKLIRLNGEGEEQYFYDLHFSDKNGIWALFDEVRKFNLVHNKQVVKLNIIQRYRLYGLLKDKVQVIKALNNVKKQMSDFEKIAIKAYSRTVEGGKQIAKTMLNEFPNPVMDVINIKNSVKRRKTTKIINCNCPSGETNKPKHKFDYEELKERYKLQLRIELEHQRTADDLTRQEVDMQKSKFQKRIEELAKKRLNDSIDKNELIKRFNR